MLLSHYIEFISNNTHAPVGACVSRVMTMLHGLMRHTETNLGVSFPAISTEFIGDKVRVFGDVPQLTTVLSNPQIQDACRRCICSLSVYVPSPVPEKSSLVSYTVVRHAGHAVNATFKRKLARYERRHNQPMSTEAQIKLRLYLVNKSQPLPYFTVKSDKGIYPIYVLKRHVKEGKAGGFNSFGLGNQGGVVCEF